VSGSTAEALNVRNQRDCENEGEPTDPTDAVDVVIVGGGSAGAVLAARRTEDASRIVLLLEAGPVYALGAIPVGLLDASHVADPDHDWGYAARGNDQQPRVPTPRGKVLGGVGPSTQLLPSDPAPAISRSGPHMVRRDGATRRSFPLFATWRTRPPATTVTTGGLAPFPFARGQTRS
jgi:hypothetical protein